MAESAADSPFFTVGPEVPASPIILSVPHAGRNYSDALLKSARVSQAKLEALEDRLMDRLVWRACANGVSAIVARAPRAEIDLNRDEREIDPALVVPPLPLRAVVQSPRTRGGLGLIPSRITGIGPIWHHRLPAAELARRLTQIHTPYHAALEALLLRARERFGVAILLDCHSMPPREPPGEKEAVVLGDRHGTSIDPLYLRAAVDAARRSGFNVACNSPYAGGYITTRHGRPARRIHALQLEVDRSLYLDAQLRSPGPGFDRVARMIEAMAEALSAAAIGPLAIAAE